MPQSYGNGCNPASLPSCNPYGSGLSGEQYRISKASKRKSPTTHAAIYPMPASTALPPGEHLSNAYTPVQQFIHEADCDLSVYRFLRPGEKKWYVVIIGEQPEPQLQQRIATILFRLTRGDCVTLDEETHLALLARRVQQTQQGDWIERHYHVPEQDK